MAKRKPRAVLPPSVPLAAGEAPGPAAPSPHFSIHLPRWLAWVFTAGMVAPWAVVGLMWLHTPASGLASNGRAPLVPGTAPVKAGPWGDLEIVPIRLAPLPEFTPEVSLPPSNWRWAFPGMTAEALRLFLAGD